MSLASDALRDARVIIIGAGAIGATLSYRLAQAGAQVTTVERRYPGAGTTGSSFAWLNSFNKPPRHYHRLNLMAIRDHQELADELDGSWLHLDGSLHWASASDSLRLANLRQGVRQLREWGARVDATTPEIAMRQLAPDLWINPESVPEVYFVPREGWVECVAMAHTVLHAAVARYAARLERAAVIGLRGSGWSSLLPPAEDPQIAPSQAVRPVAEVLLDDGRALPADVVINAAGPDAPRIGAMAGVGVAVDRQLGMLVATAPAPVCLRQVVRAGEVNLRPDGGARLLLTHAALDRHAVEGRPTPLEAPEVQDTLARARRVLPGLADVPAEAVRIGVRAMPRDGFPIVGFEPSAPGLYTVATHSGITLCARLAQLVVEDLLGADPPELAPFRPTRFVDGGRLSLAAGSDE